MPHRALETADLILTIQPYLHFDDRVATVAGLARCVPHVAAEVIGRTSQRELTAAVLRHLGRDAPRARAALLGLPSAPPEAGIEHLPLPAVRRARQRLGPLMDASDVFTTLRTAITSHQENGNDDQLRRIVDGVHAAGGHVDDAPFRSTALHFLAYEYHNPRAFDAMKILVAKGADVNLRDAAHRTPLAIADQRHRGVPAILFPRVAADRGTALLPAATPAPSALRAASSTRSASPAHRPGPAL